MSFPIPVEPTREADMQDRNKTKAQLMEELAGLRRRTAELEALVSKLKQTEASFQRLTKHGHALIYSYRLKPTPGFEYVSPSATALTGYTPEEYYADPTLGAKLIHPDDRPLLEAFVRSPSSPQPLTVRWIHKDGHMVWTEHINAPVYDEQGNLVALEGIAHDITQRKRTEDALQANEEKFRSIIEQSADGVVVTDETGMVIEWNQGQEQITGLRPGEVIGRPVWDVLYQTLPHEQRTPAMYEWLKANTLEAIKTGQVAWFNQLVETEIERPDGERRNVQGIMFPIKTNQGFMVAGTYRDITERKQAEQKIRDSEQFLQAVFDGIQDGISILDRDLNIVRVNRTMEQWYSHARPLPGKKCFIAYQGRAEPCEVCPTLRTLDLGTPQMNQVPLTGPAGVEGWLELYAFPLFDPAGNPTGVIEYVRNITQRKRAEEQLHRQNEYLAALHATTLELMNRLELTDLLENIVTRAAQLLGTSHGYLYLVNPAQEQLEWQMGCGIFSQPPEYPIKPGEGLTGRVAQTGQPLIVDHYDAWPGRLPQAPLNEFTAIVGMPLKSGSQVTGVIVIARVEPGQPFDESDLDLLSRLAQLASIALENARLYKQAQQRAEQMATINRIGLALTSGLDMDRVLRELDWQCQQVVTVDMFYVALYDAATGQIRFPMVRKGGEYRELEPIDLSSTHGFTGHVIQSRQTLYVPDELDLPPTLPAQPIWIGGERTRSYVGVPLIVRDQVIGVVSMQSFRPYAYCPDHIRMLETVATQAAIAIENARLYADAQQRARHMALLNDITRTISSTLDPQEMFKVLANRLGELFDADGAFITRWDETRQTTLPTAAYGPWDEAYSRLRPLPGETTMTASVLEAGHVLVAEDVFNSPYISPRIAALFPARSMLALPLIADGKKLGAALISFNRPHRFTADEIARGEQVAGQLALAIAKAQLLQTTENERSRLQALIKASRDGIVLNSLDGYILVANEPALQMLQLPGQPEDWLGRRFGAALEALERWAPTIVQIARAEIQRLQSGDESPGEGEFEIPPHVIHWQNLPVTTGATPLGRLIVLRDVTEQRAVEQWREDMTHTMVHDLRNPLGNISTTIEVLRSGILGDLAPDQLAALKAGEVSVRRMTSLINAILDVNELESKRSPLEPKAFHLADLVTEILQAQSALAREKNLRLENAVAPSLPPAWGDVTLIGRVLQNLVDNACKFTPGGGTVRVTAQAEPLPPGSVLMVSVSDTGPGVPARIQSQLFQKFVRGPQRERGSGLGLAFCRLAIEAHGERIWIEHTSEHGTTITFSLATVPPA